MAGPNEIFNKSEYEEESVSDIGSETLDRMSLNGMGARDGSQFVPRSKRQSAMTALETLGQKSSEPLQRKK